ncbi:hypothetical protein GCM10017674_39450 [Streptomyces gardneri]|uniref:Uncharacterized protein n=1 Tax=Streptomyces gardneri TaxID=66892 RepID=A0A4Y3RIV0_9ACTN|nr:hypothetical protein SGA01_32810 [Streptomyces gardneri]GHH02565.1 hypothetical protein GCM10017674_39450 [Streptomyces gardneri]
MDGAGADGEVEAVEGVGDVVAPFLSVPLAQALCEDGVFGHGRPPVGRGLASPRASEYTVPNSEYSVLSSKVAP